jgi:CDP-diacylglycerol--glycerol-3-phosphate 3-phosphatidyltransferase
MALVFLFGNGFSGPAFEALWVTLFILACASDFLDGMIARRYPEQASEFGKVIDPIADKVLVISASAILFLWGSIDVVEVVCVSAIIIRELLVTFLRKPFIGDSNHLAVSAAGRWKAGFQMFAFGILLGRDGVIAGEINMALTPFMTFDGLGRLLLIVAVGLTLWSGWGYLKTYLQPARSAW